MATEALPPRWGLIEDWIYQALTSPDAEIPIEWQADVLKGVEECKRLQQTLKQQQTTRHIISHCKKCSQ